MKVFNNFKVGKKLVLVFSCIVIAVGVEGYNSLASSSEISGNAEAMYSNSLISVRNLEQVSSDINEVRVSTANLLYKRNKSETDGLVKTIDDKSKEVTKLIAEYEKVLNTYDSESIRQEKANLKTFKEDYARYSDIREELVNLSVAGKYDEAVKLNSDELTKYKDAVVKDLQDGVALNTAEADELHNSNISSYNKAKVISIVCISFVLLVTCFMGYLLYASIVLPLRKLQASANRLEDYDFTTSIEVTRSDEFGQTAVAINKAQDNLRGLIATIISGATGLEKYSVRLSSAMTDLHSKAVSVEKAVENISDGVQNSSSATEEISASVEEVNASVSVLSSKALDSSNLAIKSKEKALEAQSIGEQGVSTALELYKQKQEKMAEVVKESDVINSIESMADVISSIAEQTNLLALNASIEAARAGEHGRGFTVVADEVRKLAEQSASTVSEIKSSISNVKGVFSKSIETGTDLLNFINTALNKSSSDLKETGDTYFKDANGISTISEDIASMSEEITATVEQVSMAIQTMAETAQKSSEEAGLIGTRMVETTQYIEEVQGIASTQLDLANELMSIVGKFKV